VNQKCLSPDYRMSSLCLRYSGASAFLSRRGTRQSTKRNADVEQHFFAGVFCGCRLSDHRLSCAREGGNHDEVCDLSVGEEAWAVLVDCEMFVYQCSIS